MIDILATSEVIQVTIPTAAIAGILALIGKSLWDKKRRNGKQSATPSGYVTKDMCKTLHAALSNDIVEIKTDVKESRKAQAITNISLAELTILIKKNGHNSPSD